MIKIHFPEDSVSTGGFQTLLMFSSWAQKGTAKLPSGECGNELLTKLPDIMLYLPMPENVGTGYHGVFDDVEGIDYIRKDINANAPDMASGIEQGLKGNTFAGSSQIQRLINGVVAGTGSGAMAQTKILSNKAGMEYKGAALREHQLTWKLTPRNEEEQEAITKMIATIKHASAPSEGKFGDTLQNWVKDYKRRDQADEDTNTRWSNLGLDWDNVGESAEALASKLTTLSIPPTVEVRYLNHGFDNKQLFRIADSFITAFDVNYTPNGHWQANMDGSAIETTISMTLKEISPITAAQIKQGY